MPNSKVLQINAHVAGKFCIYLCKKTNRALTFTSIILGLILQGSVLFPFALFPFKWRFAPQAGLQGLYGWFYNQTTDRQMA